ncbi:MAG: 2-hydroxyacyl-CoA dehydratase family protein, partial [Lachnospiraceae bacterium]|nr:2-hydroxyacyl-CoA dehydratase family protein [Lachnospiraceae bacterium]
MNNKLYYVCKYTPLELLAAFGAQCENLNHMPEGFDTADQIAHPNICGFGKSVLEAVLAGDVRELVLVNCCDTIRSVYDLLQEAQPSETSRVDDTAEAALRFEQGQDGLPEEVVQMDFLYMLDMLHCGNDCSRERVAAQLKDLAKKYGEYKGRTFDPETFRAAFAMPQTASTEKAGATARLQPHIAVLGARMGEELFEMAVQQMPLPLVNETCVYNRSVTWTYEGDLQDFDSLMDWYAGELLGQIPCMRMVDNTGRRQLYQDPSLKGIIYHTVKFCDFYSFEYAQIKAHTDVPLLKIESDYTVQSSGQLLTRFEAFAESLSLNPQTAEAIREFHESAQNTGVGCGFNDGEQGVKANRRFSRGGRITGVIPGSVGDNSETGGLCGGCER